MIEDSVGTVKKKNGMIACLPIILSAMALVLSVVGLVRVSNVYRQIIYAGQALICVYIIIQMGVHLKDGSKWHIKVALYAYAVLEALRATILVTIGVNTIVGYVARFVLIILACSCVLTAERIERTGSEMAAYSIIALEIVLYLVFLFGFPGIMLGHLNRFLPLVSVLMSACFCIVVKSMDIQTVVSNSETASL